MSVEVADQIAFTSESLLTLRTGPGFISRGRGDIAGLVVQSLVPGEKLFLSEGLAALGDWVEEGFEASVDQIVAVQVFPDCGAVGTLGALQVLLSPVSSLVHLQAVSIRQLKATLAEVRPITAVQLSHVNSQVSSPAKRAVTEVAGNHLLLVRVNLHVRFQRITLSEGLQTVAALVGFLPCMNSDVSL